MAIGADGNGGKETRNRERKKEDGAVLTSPNQSCITFPTPDPVQNHSIRPNRRNNMTDKNIGEDITWFLVGDKDSGFTCRVLFWGCDGGGGDDSSGGGGDDGGGGVQSAVSVCVVGGIAKGRHTSVNEGVVGGVASGVSGSGGRSIWCAANGCSDFRDFRLRDRSQGSTREGTQ